MSPELEKRLYDKYPLLFGEKDKSMQETCMCWGCECDDGWFKILDRLCSYLQFNIDHNRHPQIKFTQVKEKFGQLRIYYNGGDDYLEGIIDFAELLSLEICEICGQSGKTACRGTWLKTVCNEHAKELGYKNVD